MNILGISALYHDSAAAILVDGKIVAAAQEERFSRKKNDARFPKNAINYVLEEAGLTLDEVDYVGFYDKPFLKFERLLETYVAYAPFGFKSFCKAMPIWLREKLFLKNQLSNEFKNLSPDFDSKKLLFGEHHLSHAASAYYPSPFDEAAILTIDGVGEWATTTLSIGKGNEIDVVKEIHFPHSLGLLYSAFTYYLGFKVNGGEYKVMGLAPYGDPQYKELILEKLMDLKEDGSFRLNQKFFNYATGLTMTNKAFDDLFGMPVRKPDIDELTQFHMDVAASIQAVTEQVVLQLTGSIADQYDVKNLCLAGGVALNCVANGKILRQGAFDDVWIQPAAGDSGGALGVALAIWHKELQNIREVQFPDSMQGSYLGPHFGPQEIEDQLLECGAIFETALNDEVINCASDALSDGLVVGWFQGRTEFGPRALGNRSILGDPRSESMQKTLNIKVKFRESFRPFAPSVLREDVADWFDLDRDSPYMLFVANVRDDKCREMTPQESALFGIEKLNIKRSEIPAVTHVDYSARIQTVHRDSNAKYHELLEKFKEKTGCPVLVNTSFNVRGEPIVNSPADAYKCFMKTNMDVLICENYIIRKTNQSK